MLFLSGKRELEAEGSLPGIPCRGEGVAAAAIVEEGDRSVFSGADTRLAEVLGLGAAGCIGGLVNFVPGEMVAIHEGVRTGREAGIPELSARVAAAGRIVDQLTFPLNVACGVEARGSDPGLPKTVVSPETERLYRKVTDDFRTLFRDWK